MKCIHCGTPMNYYFSKKEFRINKCPACQLMAVENVPADLSPYYAAGYFTGDVSLDGYMDYDREKEVTRRTYEHYLDTLTRHLGSTAPVKMFEVGCATGFFMALARSRQWHVAGIDISAYAVEQAKQKNLSASVATLDTYTTAEVYDVVVMQDVIEHVKDPVATIAQARGLLRAGGLLALTTPDAGSLWARAWGKRWHAFVPPQHLFYFSTNNLSSLLERNGFTIVSRAHEGKWFTLPYIMRLLFSWTGLKVFSWAAGLLARSPLKNLAIPINVRDTAFITARKI